MSNFTLIKVKQSLRYLHIIQFARFFLVLDVHICTFPVSPACYGIVQVPTGPWFCRKCESQERAARVVSHVITLLSRRARNTCGLTGLLSKRTIVIKRVPPLAQTYGAPVRLAPICRDVKWHGKKLNWCRLKEDFVDWHDYLCFYVSEGFFSKSPSVLWPLPVCHFYICVLCSPRHRSPPNGFNPDCKDVRLKIIFRDICGLLVYCVASSAVNINL